MNIISLIVLNKNVSFTKSLSHFYRSRVQKGCHCGLVGDNAHLFESKFEFKSGHKCLSVEPRRGTISNNQVTENIV